MPGLYMPFQRLYAYVETRRDATHRLPFCDASIYLITLFMSANSTLRRHISSFLKFHSAHLCHWAALVNLAALIDSHCRQFNPSKISE